MADVKRVYTFGNKEAEGNGKMRELLGGKGANLAEMNLIGIPVPPGFTITTEVCSEYYAQGREKVVGLLRPEVEKAMKNIEKLTGMKFGDKEMPLLVSVRSGARASMPGMMDTILNLGMNDQAVEAVAKRTGNPRFAWDSYRRFVQMYGDVVLGMKPASKEEHDPFEELIDAQKEKRGVKNDTDLTTDDLKERAQLQGCRQEADRRGFPGMPVGSALGRRMRRIRFVDERACHPLPQAQQHSGGMGHGRIGTGDGIRQHGRQLGDRRSLLARRSNG